MVWFLRVVEFVLLIRCSSDVDRLRKIVGNPHWPPWLDEDTSHDRFFDDDSSRLRRTHHYKHLMRVFDP